MNGLFSFAAPMLTILLSVATGAFGYGRLHQKTKNNSEKVGIILKKIDKIQETQITELRNVAKFVGRVEQYMKDRDNGRR
jgi:hypothetical protein